MKRDFRLSVSKENRDYFDICKVLKSKGYSPSNFTCIATREKFNRDVKIVIQKAVLSPPQQKAEPTITITKSKVIKEVSETQRKINLENQKRDLAARILVIKQSGDNGNENMKITAGIQIKKLQDELDKLINS